MVVAAREFKQKDPNDLSALTYSQHSEIDVERYKYSFHEMTQLSKIPFLKIVVLFLAFTAATLMTNLTAEAIEKSVKGSVRIFVIKILAVLLFAILIAVILAYVETLERASSGKKSSMLQALDAWSLSREEN